MRNMDLHLPPKWSFEDSEVDLFEDDAILLDAVLCRGQGICIDAREYAMKLCAFAGDEAIMRASMVLRQTQRTLSLPVFNNHTTTTSCGGDWRAWRFLVLLHRLVPGAYTPMRPPLFRSKDAHLTRLLQSWLTDYLNEQREAAEDNPWLDREQWVQGLEDVERILRVHQRDAAEDMLGRSEEGFHAHFLSMDTGAGKSLTAVYYAMQWMFGRMNWGRWVRRIIWITPPGAMLSKEKPLDTSWKNYQMLKSLMNQFTGRDALVQLPIYHVHKKHAVFPDWTICVCSQDHIRAMPKKLNEAMRDSFLIVDEVDQLYGPTKRTDDVLRLAYMARGVIAQTATPIPTRTNLINLQKWLKLTVDYPVDSKNYLVAASNMISAIVDLDITSHYHAVEVPQCEETQRAMAMYMEDRRFRLLYNTLRDLTNLPLLREGLTWALRDRAAHEGGGCLIVSENDTHAAMLLEIWETLEEKHGIKAGTVEHLANPDYGIIIISLRHSRGYNAGVRLGALVTQPYA